MAHLHFQRTVYKSGGGKATARIEYITRQPDHSAYVQQERYIVHEDREDLVYEHTRNLPAWAEGNPHTYFRAAEQGERLSPNDARRRGIAFEEWKVTLPHELTLGQNMRLMRDLVDQVAGSRLPITYAFHNPKTLDGTAHQPHLHLLISARQHDAHPRTAETHFKRWNVARPERGGAQKDPAFWHKGAIKAHRMLLSDVINAHLEHAGLAARVHPGRLDDRQDARMTPEQQQQRARTPEPKLLPSESRAYREQGIISPGMQQVLDMRQARAAPATAKREADQARRWWEARKRTLGITATSSMPNTMWAIAEARAQCTAHAPGQEPVVDLDKVWTKPLLGHAITRTYHTPDQVAYDHLAPTNQVRFHTAREAQEAGYRPSKAPRFGEESGVARTRQERQVSLTRQLARLLRSRDETAAHGDLNVRLHDEERDRDRGMSW